MAISRYNEWLCKTNFSFLTGASHPYHLIKTASDFGYQSICVNDFDGVYGAARMYRELGKLKSLHGVKDDTSIGGQASSVPAAGDHVTALAPVRDSRDIGPLGSGSSPMGIGALHRGSTACSLKLNIGKSTLGWYMPMASMDEF